MLSDFEPMTVTTAYFWVPGESQRQSEKAITLPEH
jgi:hypothetical protein